MTRSSPFRLALVAGACILAAAPALAQTAPKAPEPATLKANAEMVKSLPFADRQDFEDAMRGFVGTVPDALVPGPSTRPAWNLKPYDFLKADTPIDSVNPSLWRQAQLNLIHGLFKVTDRVYQVRGFDLANMTIIEGDNSLILIDPLLAVETSRAALDLYYQHRPKKPVGAVIYTHSHSDHFGGVKGVISEADVAAGKVQVIAPSGFMEAAVAENILAGTAMSRRAHYQFGVLLPSGPRGQVDGGLGKRLAGGTTTLIAPTSTIEKTTEERTIDGVPFVFRLVPSSEAPSEMLIHLPQQRVLNMAEDVAHTMHNLYTIRGAEVRDGNLWAKYIDQARLDFGDKSDMMITQHHWPVTGRERVVDLLAKQRDMYKFINDQTLRLLNHGLGPQDIAEQLRMPASLEREWSARGYYGTLRHNAKAVYQKYLGWYDANPANLDPLPPVPYAKKTVEYMGGADAVLARAREDFKKGEYRWVASAMNQLVFADPANSAARELGADALEQLGYQSEAATWRNAYLAGAMELRGGVPKIPARSSSNPDTLKATSNELYFDYMAVRLNAAKAEGKKVVINWNFTDSKQQLALTLENSALTHAPGQARNADATLTLSRATLDAITLRQTTFPEAIQSGQIKLEGDRAKIGELLGMLDTFEQMFPIVEPKK
ncbi:alkyl sulfatase dimerization domain-containing protein [Ottowia sp.]|jgi:alkyl sulfatase BDS1-like metallo-beta-lactamase superfamily hydrolase|uniref:alkyl/aryl-sulfatase n=1 Tax=Ottowia sp. TaxID=1898956 RepID=UPI0025D8B518|nr:alkyl sulfatase dimerization domain-containing protein [Ottowia sp.]MBK6614579.1 MBL fold metallo-hydrolase [Ottowia sp.]MBK6745668.1 MBL fold metallo-hydrolase [Ottowia sp.]